MTNFGEKIRIERRSKSLSLKQLSQKTGLSISFLSEVERGISQPSIASLKKIAQALGVSLLGLSSNGNPSNTDNLVSGIPAHPLARHTGPYITKAKVVRAGRRKRISFPEMKGYFELLTPDFNRLIEALSFKAIPGFVSGQEQVSDLPGEKFMLILEGTLEFHVGEDVFVLNEMDSLSYPADAPIFYKVIGEKTVKGILIITPPGF
jgi:transcriptional regulator with XRE-family HTH domain